MACWMSVNWPWLSMPSPTVTVQQSHSQPTGGQWTRQSVKVVLSMSAPQWMKPSRQIVMENAARRGVLEDLDGAIGRARGEDPVVADLEIAAGRIEG